MYTEGGSLGGMFELHHVFIIVSLPQGADIPELPEAKRTEL